LSHSVRVLFEPLGRRGEAKSGESILDVAVRLGVGLRSECGGTRSCGKCRVIIEGGGVTEAETLEIKRFTAEEIRRGYRLACAARILPGTHRVTVTVPPESVLRARQFSGVEAARSVRLDPLVKKYVMSFAQPLKPTPDALLQELRKQHKLTGLSVEEGLRVPAGAESVTVYLLDGWTIIAAVEGDQRLLGVAVDVGTSRVTARLIDLGDGSTLSSESVENPQIIHGENLITRAAHAQRSDENRLRLRTDLIDAINMLIAKLVEANGVERGDILQAVVVGNTVMHHLLLGLDTSRLTRAPFTPATKVMAEFRGDESGITINPRGLVTLLPNIDAFVGADAVADIISINLTRRSEPTLLLDIGTNTEIMLRAGGETLACSCASGPAFEGEHIEHGMKAVEGAIEGVRIGGGVVDYTTIGGAKPVGICGSGIVDAVACLLREGLISGVGRFREAPNPRLIHVGGQRKFIIAPAEQSGTGADITISEKDVNEVILAKAAISSAAEVLMAMKGVHASDLRRVLVAGAFGGHLDKVNAKTIGLIPDVENRRITSLGNAALEGAAMALKSRRTLRQATKIAEETRYVELASNADFDAGFRKALLLRPPARNDISPK
jgi:uncharacterized 2Fe-2S/4Fe-4S cluster protein (DUF4445 family)